MTPETAEKLKEFFNAFAGEATPFLLLDYDGTLAPFRRDRFQARPWAGVRELLLRIQQQGRTRMAIITGRSAREIGPLLAMDPPLEVWGLHGAERLFPNGRSELQLAPEKARDKLNMLRALLKRDSFGGLFENKANGAVIHWRGASSHKARLIEKKARSLFEPLAGTDGLELLEFEAGLELRIGRDKGGAVKKILREAEPRSPVAYLGDDATDEAAFRTVNSFGPHCLAALMRRRSRETEADVWLRPPVELRGFLAAWLQAGENSLWETRVT